MPVCDAVRALLAVLVWRCWSWCCAVAGAGQVAVWWAQGAVVRWLLAVLVWSCSRGAALTIATCLCWQWLWCLFGDGKVLVSCCNLPCLMLSGVYAGAMLKTPRNLN